ncbi:hypothetical protein Tco_0769596 [Tanacetum coccineum]|uniref:Uncharacterized protein n=1 Tax=Tanacetum coccineum TaxID=301880 RepID=A0ABQ4ZAV9_9ASTR
MEAVLLVMINQRLNVSTAIKWDIWLDDAGHPRSKDTEIGIKREISATWLSWHSQILRQTTLDLSYSGLEEFKHPEVNEYGPRDSSVKPTTGCDKESENSKETQ